MQDIDLHWFNKLAAKVVIDKGLSWQARGMMAFIIGKYGHKSIEVSMLVKETAASRKKAGRDAVYVVLNELIDAGYLYRSTNREGDGRFLGQCLVIAYREL